MGDSTQDQNPNVLYAKEKERKNEWINSSGRSPVLATYVPRVQAARKTGIGSAFNDRPAVGEQCHLVRFAPELEHEFIVPHLAVRTETFLHRRKIQGPFALVDLHGISSAQSNVRTAFARQMNELTTSAGLAIGTRAGG